MCGQQEKSSNACIKTDHQTIFYEYRFTMRVCKRNKGKTSKCFIIKSYKQNCWEKTRILKKCCKKNCIVCLVEETEAGCHNFVSFSTLFLVSNMSILSGQLVNQNVGDSLKSETTVLFIKHISKLVTFLQT